jgi:redox-sensing transcriptional repressor
MTDCQDVSSLILNRLSLYLRCLRNLQGQGIRRVSSKELAQRFHLSAPLIRKDLAQFGEFGIRGTGYDVKQLAERLNGVLGLDREHRLVVVGMGSLGSALARYVGLNHDAFQVVAGFDIDGRKVGRRVGDLTIHHVDTIAHVVAETDARIAVLTVPARAAQSCYDAVVEAGIRAVLNFAPVGLTLDPQVRTKNVDFQVNLEELAFFLRA